MSNQSLIDSALATAKARLSAGVERMNKEAAAPGDEFTKEAAEVANALEYVALNAVDDGSAAGTARREMVEDYLKKSAAAHAPKQSATTTSGTQSQVPSSSKKKVQPGGTPGGSRPEASSSMGGKQPENILRQMPPATKPTPKDGGGKSASMSLYDILMSNKEAAAGGPMEMDAEQSLPGVPQGGDGQAHAHALLSSNTAPVQATKRQAKAPTRPRLSEVWDSANDTTGDASARAVWPNAASKGDMKIAEADCACDEVHPGKSHEEYASKDDDKTASIDELVTYSEVFDRALNGEFGKEAQAYAEQIEAL